jgi:hypothetical protein
MKNNHEWTRMDANLIDSFVSIRVYSWLVFVTFGWGNAALRSFTANWYWPTSLNGSSLDGVLSLVAQPKKDPEVATDWIQFPGWLFSIA